MTMESGRQYVSADEGDPSFRSEVAEMIEQTFDGGPGNLSLGTADGGMVVVSASKIEAVEVIPAASLAGTPPPPPKPVVS